MDFDENFRITRQWHKEQLITCLGWSGCDKYFIPLLTIILQYGGGSGQLVAGMQGDWLLSIRQEQNPLTFIKFLDLSELQEDTHIVLTFFVHNWQHIKYNISLSLVGYMTEICYDWVVEPPVHVHEIRQEATLSGCSRWFNQWLITISAVPGFHLIRP